MSKALMSDAERGTLLAAEGPNYVAWEWVARWLRRWRDEHPDDERGDLDILTSDDYPSGLGIGGPATQQAEGETKP